MAKIDISHADHTSNGICAEVTGTGGGVLCWGLGPTVSEGCEEGRWFVVRASGVSHVNVDSLANM